MFACVYCDDNTLVVIGKQSKRLKLLGDFEAKQKVELSWPGTDKIYNGIIVKIDEKEDYLTEFANKAYSKYLKHLKTGETVPVELYTFQHDMPLSAKRSRVKTQKSQESREQELVLSPKKKKKEEVKEKEGNVKSRELILTPNKKKKEEGKEKGNVKTRETKAEALITPNAVKTKKKKVEEQMTQALGSTIFSDLDSQFAGTNKTAESHAEESETSLTKTWSVCTGTHDTDRDKYPVPSPFVLNFLEAMVHPEVQDFVMHIVNMHKNRQDNQQKAEKTYTELTPLVDQLNYQEPSHGEFSYSTTVIREELPPLRRSPRKHVSSQNVTERQSGFEYIHAAPNTSKQNLDFSPTAYQDYPLPFQQTFQPTAISQYNPAPITASSELIPVPTASSQLMSPAPSPAQTSLQFTSPAPVTSNLQFTSPAPAKNNLQFTSPAPITPGSEFIPVPTASSQLMSPAPSPAKTNIPSAAAGSQNQVAGPCFRNSQEMVQNENRNMTQNLSTPQKPLDDDCNTMVRLFKGSDIFVKREELRKVWASAKKAPPAKTAFRLACCILPLLFKKEELANSCGQGLKRKPGEIRPQLDANKITLLKDYVTAWCQKNASCDVLDSHINDAITEQVSYARKKLKRGN